ncbi:putative DNA modification/repair radical SAM protein [Clostridium sp. 'deep sea']|uniref:putative DNA modification/repair radical SAM protein n=1 Tax=Clostridium sp. 'deep sea' TaxID=2779445 RepID=UPI001896569F|nr:putative DNA modification/repair radical SAM protein [Clostridium sp. 'deep sea']QOR33621.1 putative DNA modification/repair radical SAM protein [Clostridium sp. 'deep sea']
MDINKKLKVLADAAKYDVSCVSSGVGRNNTAGGIGSSAASGICHTWAADGRCISLLKILLTNKCVYDCKYCVNRLNCNTARASFTPRQVADLTIQFYRRNYIEGLFLSSAVEKSPNYTMENLYRAIFLLRTEYRFNGYIHVKAIPGADPMLVYKLGLLVDRMSVNLELPSVASLKQLAPQKKYTNLLQPMNFIAEQIQAYPKLKKYTKKRSFVPGGQSTQFIVGASNDTDLALLTATERLYNKFSLRRVFYSAYVAINEDSDLPAVSSKPPLKREHRLYQADWLLRFYNFEANELLNSSNPFFDEDFDPKIVWAFRHPEIFPIEINKADYKMLLRIPGIGPTTAQRIVRQRRLAAVTYHNLKKMKVVLKRAQYFITCNGRYYGDVAPEPQYIKAALLNPTRQMSIWGG